MTRVHEMDMLLTDHIANWPFLAAQRLLKLQLSRLRVIKQALTIRLDGHPLHGNNLPGFNNPDPNMDTRSDAGSWHFGKCRVDWGC